jgi:cytochrome c-type biogenesis protein CcmH
MMHTWRPKLRLLHLWALAFGAVLYASVGALAESTSSSRRPDRASEIEQRLFAPCCWTQTLDVHDSDLSTQLRVEIRNRLTHGESELAIEDDLARRFGDRIRAVPRGADARGAVPVTIGACMVLSLLALVALARRGRQRLATGQEPAADSMPDSDATYELALARELARRDEA